MGKRKTATASDESQHSPSTVFVANLPFSFTNTQMEEAFSEIGPIRRCFMVTKKGTTEHRGFGYVQFASVEDANRAIELKNGSVIGGRKVVVKQAMHRAPLEQRRAKGGQEDGWTENDKAVKTTGTVEIRKALYSQGTGELKEKRKGMAIASGLCDGDNNSSEKQRVAKTVVFGGLLSADMAEEVHDLARKFDSLCSVTYPLSEEDLKQHGLAQDGCTMNASCVLYKSVKSARECVAALHLKEIHGGTVWARQLGGEGSKTQKWKLIVRNLPFKAKAAEIKDVFTSVGFVWDVVIPKNPETGLSKGYAFVKFTSKHDAEKAIQVFNGNVFGKRPIAVDWAIPKKIYKVESNFVASTEDEQEQDDGSSTETEDTDDEPIRKLQVGSSDHSADELDSSENNDSKSEVDFEKEAEIARNVLNNLISQSPQDVSEGNELESTEGIDDKYVPVGNNSSEAKTTTSTLGEEDELHKTIFICNLPFEVTADEVKQRFSSFGEVQSFVPVLNQVTKRPRGTGFLKFRTTDAVNATLSEANTVGGVGIIIKGRAVKVLKALDKKTAHSKSEEKEKKEDHDHRNLYLAKEGLIMEGMHAAEGVSANDLSKRRKLYEDKMAKLQSPNFRVSTTRLIVYNVPKNMNEKDLRQLFINAVVSRATKQKPSIRQIKILKDSKKGKEGEKSRPRGVAFLEFTEHQHALVALRVLNNNPDTFDPQHRPIVEFALDNVQKLKLRTEKLLQSKQQGPHNGMNDTKKNDYTNSVGHAANTKSRIRKPRGAEALSNKMVGDKSRGSNDKLSENPTVEEGRVSKKQKVYQRGMKSGLPDKKTKTPKMEDTNQHKGEGSTDIVTNKPETREIDMTRKQRALNVLSEQSKGLRKRGKKDPVGCDVGDKLDMLIEQYRAKFVGNDSAEAEDKKHGSKRLKRWFES